MDLGEAILTIEGRTESGGGSPSAAVRGIDEIASGTSSGGPNTSHTIVVAALAALLDAVPPMAPAIEYERAALELNVLGKGTEGARRRTFRYLRELYILRPNSVLFRALRELWSFDPEARPLLAGLCALARDPVFRASSSAIVGSVPGEGLTSADLAAAVGEQFPDSYSPSTLAKVGRNTFSSWEQTGHLKETGSSGKVRVQASCSAADVAYALLLGYLQGIRGGALLDTLWVQVLDRPRSVLLDLALVASQRGMIDLRQAGGIVDVTFRELLRPFAPHDQGRLT